MPAIVIDQNQANLKISVKINYPVKKKKLEHSVIVLIRIIIIITKMVIIFMVNNTLLSIIRTIFKLRISNLIGRGLPCHGSRCRFDAGLIRKIRGTTDVRQISSLPASQTHRRHADFGGNAAASSQPTISLKV